MPGAEEHKKDACNKALSKRVDPSPGEVGASGALDPDVLLKIMAKTSTETTKPASTSGSSAAKAAPNSTGGSNSTSLHALRGDAKDGENSSRVHTAPGDVGASGVLDPDVLVKIMARASAQKTEPTSSLNNGAKTLPPSDSSNSTSLGVSRREAKDGGTSSKATHAPAAATGTSSRIAEQASDEFDIELMKVIAERSRDASNNTTTHTTTEEDIHTYSSQAKKRIAGPVQPGAFGAAPGEKPSRFESLRYSTFNHSTPEAATTIETIGEQQDEKSQNDRSISSNSNSSQHLSSTGLSTYGDEIASTHDIEFASFPEKLVTARAVDPESEDALEVESVATEYFAPTEEAVLAKDRRRNFLLGSSFCALCIIILGIVMIVLYFTNVLQPKKSAEGTTIPSASPTMAPTPYFLDLPDSTIETIETDPNSPQSRAYQWLHDDPLLNSYNDTQTTQRFALAVVYYANKGEYWTLNDGWLSYEMNECEWYNHLLSVHAISGACDMNGNLLVLELTKNGLSGTLPAELSLLSHMKVLDVATNSIDGNIPTQIGTMATLTGLFLDGNLMSGQLPSEIGGMTQLESLYLIGNPFLSGTIVTELGLLTNMLNLQWAGTETTGAIPSEIGLMSQLTNLYLHANLLSGTIPSEIGNLVTLNYAFSLQHNFLNGTIPSEIGLLSKVEVFYLEINSLSGSIPSEIGKARNAQFINLRHNSLNSTIPSQVGQLSSLTWLRLGDNNLAGPLPSQLGLLKNLSFFLAENNALSSSVPQEFYYPNLRNVVVFAVSENDLTGTIPAKVGQWSSLQGLALGGNKISGSIPSEIGDLTNALTIHLGDMDLNGTIPSEIGRLTSLVELRLDNTNISGEIPSEFESWVQEMHQFHVHNTLVSGTVPSNLCTVPDLVFNCSEFLCGCDCKC